MKTLYFNKTTSFLAIVLLFVISPMQVLANNQIHLGDYGGRPTVDISINGSAPFPVLVDTGFKGGQLMLNFDKATELGLQVESVQDVQNMGQGKVLQMTKWQPQHISIGDHNVELEHVSSLKMDRRLKPGSPLGIISFWALSSRGLSLDLTAKNITIVDDMTLTTTSPNTISLSNEDTPLPYFTVTINDQSLEAHIDTGSPAGLTLPLDMKDNFEFIEAPKVMGEVRIPGYLADLWQGKIKGKLNIGGHMFENPEVNFLAPIQWVNIGSDILKDFIVLIDQTNKLIQFNKPN